MYSEFAITSNTPHQVSLAISVSLTLTPFRDTIELFLQQSGAQVSHVSQKHNLSDPASNLGFPRSRQGQPPAGRPM